VFSIEDDENTVYRKLSPAYLTHYQHFISSGLSTELIKKNWMIPFEEIVDEDGTIVLKARKISFVSYPYEWTFLQWKDAALLTLKIQYQALKYGMNLKDATPFNIVFDGCKPLFIDLSSFEIFKNGKPWQAFKQFTENFYLPLLLVKYFNSVGNDIFLNNLNGIPLSKGLQLLPAKAYLNFNTLFFLALPGQLRMKIKNGDFNKTSKKFTLNSSMQFADQLFSAINRLTQSKQRTKWSDYYENNTEINYLRDKETLIKKWIEPHYKEKSLIDFGCNTGNFSKILAHDVHNIIAFDEDIRSVDELYLFCKEKKISNIFSFAGNLSQPSPAAGWNNMERPALKERLCADIGLVLALIHHLAINSHIHFNMMADFFADSCKELFIEFVPREDAKVELLLLNREDIFDWYNMENFLTAFNVRFNLEKEHRFPNNRTLLHFIRK
jgi:hypothetical protein